MTDLMCAWTLPNSMVLFRANENQRQINKYLRALFREITKTVLMLKLGVNCYTP